MNDPLSQPVPEGAGQTFAPLVDGDCLSAREFLKRYLPRRGTVKAELIGGLVAVDPESRRAVMDLSTSMIRSCLRSYAIQTPGTRMDSDAVVVLGWDTVPQPSLVLRVLPEYGGRSRMSTTNVIEQAPELMVDFATNEGAFDQRGKLRAFRSNGVVEYLIWWSDSRTLDWYTLERGEYTLVMPDFNGVLASPSFPGLRLNHSALVNQTSGAFMATLQKSLQSREHAGFVERLARKRAATQSPNPGASR
jgi:hypothetical protein